MQVSKPFGKKNMHNLVIIICIIFIMASSLSLSELWMMSFLVPNAHGGYEKVERGIFVQIWGNFFLSVGWWYRGGCHWGEDRQKRKSWFTRLTNAVIGEYNCVRISPHLGVNKKAKWHHSHCKQRGASCHADAAKKLVTVAVHLMLAHSLSHFLSTISHLLKGCARNVAGYRQFILFIRLEKS